MLSITSRRTLVYFAANRVVSRFSSQEKNSTCKIIYQTLNECECETLTPFSSISCSSSLLLHFLPPSLPFLPHPSPHPPHFWCLALIKFIHSFTPSPLSSPLMVPHPFPPIIPTYMVPHPPPLPYPPHFWCLTRSHLSCPPVQISGSLHVLGSFFMISHSKGAGMAQW